MRVCHIICAFRRYDTRIFWKQCRALARNGFDVVLITNDELCEEIKEGIRIIPSGFRHTSRIKRIIFSRKFNLHKALEINADIYQIHDPEFIPLALKLKKRKKCIVYDSHEDFPRQILEKDWIPRFLRRIISSIIQIYFKFNLKKFDAIFTVTPHIAARLSTTSDRVKVVTNYPVVENNFTPFTEEEYSTRGKRILYSGTIYRSSLQENILKALSDLNAVEYILVGSIDKRYESDLTQLDFFGKVNFIEYVPREELFEIYRQASVGIAVFDYSPNLGYKTGSLGVNKIFEYMYFGLPVICTDFLLWKAFIDKYNCGICVNPHNIHEIRQAIIYLSNNVHEAFLMGQNGRNAIINEYNWGTQEKIYLDTFSSLMKSV